MKSAKLLVMMFLVASACAQVATSKPGGSKEVEAVYPEAYALYLDLHQNPELSSHEVQTAAKLASRLRGLGYDVTEHVGGTGIVAILKNGADRIGRSAGGREDRPGVREQGPHQR